MTTFNCWEFKKCGREAGGAAAGARGVCPAAQQGLDGDGKKCWTVAGSFAPGKPRGTFAAKYSNCASCEFYRLMRGAGG